MTFEIPGGPSQLSWVDRGGRIAAIGLTADEESFIGHKDAGGAPVDISEEEREALLEYLKSL